MSAKRRASIAAIVVVTFVAGILAATFGANVLGIAHRVGSDTVASVANDPQSNAPVASLPDSTPFEEVFVQVADIVNPAVVQIRSERVSRSESNQTHPFFEGFPFEEFFRRNMPPQEFRSQALGSGLIIRYDGYIITNNHVIQGADELEVKLFRGDFYDAEVVGTDPNSDLAVIKIAATGLPTIPSGTKDEIRVGQWVMAFGSPLSEDLGNTVTAGIVSGIGRTSFELSRLNSFSSFIQTDAAINPGNSGGPLVNLRGELIGINSAIFSRSGGYQGVGFAIPVDVVSNVTTQLIDSGTVERGFLGVSFGPVSPSLSRALDVPRGAAQVESITESSAAEKAGLRPGDVITTVDGFDLQDYNQLRTIIGNKLPGDSVELSVVREGDRKKVTVKLGRRDEDAIAQNLGRADSNKAKGMEALGISVRAVTPELLRQIGVSDTKISGVIITEISQSSDAYREADLRERDIITEVDKKGVQNEDEFVRAIDSIKPGELFLVKVVRPAGETTRSFITALNKPAAK